MTRTGNSHVTYTMSESAMSHVNNELDVSFTGI